MIVVLSESVQGTKAHRSKSQVIFSSAIFIIDGRVSLAAFLMALLLDQGYLKGLHDTG